MSSNPKFIEVYSGNRNRMLYPLQSSFVVPFSSTLQNMPSKNYLDQTVKGSIYFSFNLTSRYTDIAKGFFQSPSGGPIATYRNAYLYAKQNPSGIIYNSIPSYLNIQSYSLITDYYKGYIIENNATSQNRIIRTFNPSTGLVTFDEPFTSPNISGQSYSIYTPYPNKDYIFVPSVDINYNVSLDYQGSYNGYYIVFESPNPNYSNADNSNIFYRKISYYDNNYRLAYFDTPLEFNYNDIDTTQEFTIRKSLPLERWTLNKATVNNKTTKDPIIGPLIGLVITLPDNASNIDNFYKGKYVYFSSNQADSYDPPYPNPDTLENPIPNTFYPIYGIYYIKAYNGKTKELSICQDLNDNSCEFTRHSFQPPTYQILNYNAGSLFGSPTDGLTNPVDTGGGIYMSYPTGVGGPLPKPYFGDLYLFESLFETGRKYKIIWNIKYQDMASASFEVLGASLPYSFVLNPIYNQIEFTFVPVRPDIYFRFYMSYTVEPNPAIVWDLFEMETVDIINICDFNNENASPLNYNGSIISQNETTCYEISLLGLTIPNVPLLTGSRIAFYPYVYVEISNITSPNKASTGIIYSNKPQSKRALFIAPVGQTARPNLGTFLTLSSSMKQTVKFKPNDSLLFRVFLPTGELVQTLLPDILSPYGPDTRLQVGALFSILRVGMDSNDLRNKIDRIKS
jgi:hypothetical protein